MPLDEFDHHHSNRLRAVFLCLKRVFRSLMDCETQVTSTNLNSHEKSQSDH